MENITNGRYILSLLNIKNNTIKSEIPGTAWIQKIMYIASNAHPEIERYGFEKFKMYSTKLENLLNELEKDGLLRTKKDAKNYGQISLTKKGRQVANKNSKTDNLDVIKTLTVIKSILNRFTYNELIAHAYTKYPEMLEKSDEKNNYEEWREDAAISMVKNDKISFSLGVQISGLDWCEFEEKINKEQVYV